MYKRTTFYIGYEDFLKYFLPQDKPRNVPAMRQGLNHKMFSKNCLSFHSG